MGIYNYIIAKTWAKALLLLGIFGSSLSLAAPSTSDIFDTLDVTPQEADYLYSLRPKLRSKKYYLGPELVYYSGPSSEDNKATMLALIGGRFSHLHDIESTWNFQFALSDQSNLLIQLNSEDLFKKLGDFKLSYSLRLLHHANSAQALSSLVNLQNYYFGAGIGAHRESWTSSINAHLGSKGLSMTLNVGYLFVL